MKKLILITTLLLSSCSSMPDAFFPNGRPSSHYEKMTIQQLSSKVKVEHNAAEQQTEYRAPKIETWKSRYLLRGWKGDNEKNIHNQLYVTLFYTAKKWRYYDKAVNVDRLHGNLKIRSLEKEVSACSIQIIGYTCNYRETIGITLPANYLELHKHSGAQIKISAKNQNTKLIRLTSKYIQAYLYTLN